MIDIYIERGRDTGRGRSRLRARRRTQSRDSRIALWAKGRCQTTEPPRDPKRAGFNVWLSTKYIKHLWIMCSVRFRWAYIWQAFMQI